MSAATVKERPILFSGPMVRALLSGAKSQTRRVMKPQPSESCARLLVGPYHPTIVVRGEEEPGPETFGAYAEDYALQCPYGKPGERLWVREAFPSIHMPRWASRLTLEITDIRVEHVQSVSFADLKAEGMDYLHEDVAAEAASLGPPGETTIPTTREIYECLWDDLNSHRGFGWDANPWVWVLEFRCVGEGQP